MNKVKRIDLYKIMYRIREFELALENLFSQGLMKGTTHFSIGQESVAAGVCAALENEDLVVSTHRGHGHYIACGGDLNSLMAEFFGKQEGLCGGRGGSQHIFDPTVGFLGANGITGGGLPVGLGAAFSMKYKKKANMVTVFIGDGASNQGTFHEVLNMASVWKLPLLVVVENNCYAMFTHCRFTTSVEKISKRSKAYGISGQTIKHDDVLEVYNIVRDIRTEIVETGSPQILEVMTYRLRGHSKSDDCSYRPHNEMNFYRENDPLKQMRHLLLNEGISETEVMTIENNENKAVQEAVKFAKQGKEPVL